MTTNKHDNYKESGIEWIGDIPAHWEIKRLKYLTTPKKQLTDSGQEELLSVTEVRGIVKRSELRASDEHLTRSDDLTGYRVVKTSELVTNIMLAWKRGLGVSPYDGIVSPAYSVFSFSGGCYPWYYNYLLRTDEYIAEFRRNSTGITMSRLRLYDDSFGDIFAYLPPIKEQKLISRFLDKKTGQIDSIVEKLQRKIELLKEQRTALINQCVTKGLNPNVEMKDSGIEWIGEIPAHWKAVRVKYIGDVTLGKMLTPNDNGGMILCKYLRSVNVQENFLNLENINEMWFSPVELEKLSIEKNDILMTEGGQVGRPCLIEKNLPRIGFQNSLNRVRTASVNPQYLFLMILSNFQVGYYDSIVERVSIPHLTKEKLENSWVIIPPNQEQEDIIHHINANTSNFNSRLNIEKKRLSLLAEYRQSLISAAVTGKIRVTEGML